MMGIKTKKHSFDYHEHLVELFLGEQKELDEEDDDFEIDDVKEEVISKIKNNEFSDDPQEFYDAINRSEKHKEMLSEYSVDDFAEMKLFILDGYDIGYALKKSQDGGYNEIVSVFNNSDVKGIGNELMKSAISNGGCYLDHYDGFLSDFSVTLDRPGEKVAVFFPVLELLIGFCFPVLDSDLTAVLFPEIMLAGREFVEELET